MVRNGWKLTRLSKLIEEHREKSTIPDQHPVFTSARSGLFLQSEYYGENRLTGRENIGFNVCPEGFLTYRSRSDDGAFYFNRNTLGTTGLISIYYPVFNFKDCNQSFMLYLLNMNPMKFYPYAVGTSQKVLSLKSLGEIKYPLPPIEEQTKIAEILSTWDKSIETTERLLENSKKRKKALMQHLLTGKKRLPGFGGEWRKVTLSCVAKIEMGTSPSSDAYNENGVGLPLVQGNADISNRKSKPRVFTSEITKEANLGDILMSVRAPVGEVSMSEHHCCIGRGICAIKANGELAIQKFIYQTLLMMEPSWASISQGSTFESVNSKDIRNLPLRIPAVDEQSEIAEILDVADRELCAIEVRLNSLKEEKKALMQQLLTGKKRVKVEAEAA